jgi:hypothetical protein
MIAPELHKTAHGAMYVFPDVVQGSEEWVAMRRGRAAKMEISKSATGYMHELIAETIRTDAPPKWMGNAWTDRGEELEPKARAAFSEMTGLEVVPVGFTTREDLIVGASPDGLIMDPVTGEFIAGLELKCPSPWEHVSYFAGGELPIDHKQQVHGGLAVTGLPVWHFFSFCPGMNPFHCSVTRDGYTERLSSALDQFVIDYVALRQKLVPLLKVSKPEPIEQPE